MRITVFISSLYGGGAERVACNLASYLTKKQNEVEILSISNDKKSYELNEKVKKYSLTSERLKLGKNIVRIYRFLKYIIIRKVDIYIVMLPIPTIMLLLFSKLTKAKIIVSERVDPTKYSKGISKLLKLLCNRANGYVFQTESIKDWYIKSKLRVRNTIIPNAINPEFIGTRYSEKRNDEIIAVGRLSKQKNFQLLIDAFAIVHKSYPNYKLLIYGEGDERKELQEKIIKNKLEKNVFLKGNVKNIKEKIFKSKIFVLSSNYEGMPNALIEAMVLGLSCISTDCDGGGAKYLIKDGYNGILIEKNNIEQMSQAIIKLIENDEYAEYLGNNASKIQEELHPSIIYGKWEKFIKEV